MSTAMATAKQRHIVGKGKNAHWVKWSGQAWVYDGKAKQGATPAATQVSSPSSPTTTATSPTPTVTIQQAVQGMTRDQKIYDAFQHPPKSVKDIAKEYSLSEATVRQIIYKQGKLQAAGYGQQVPAKYGDKQGTVAPDVKLADKAPSGKLNKDAIYAKLSPEDKKYANMGGVLGADSQALSYIKDNFVDIFGKGTGAGGGGGAPVPKYISKIELKSLDRVYGTRMGWTFRGEDLWDELEEKAGAWSGDAEQDKKLAGMGRRIAAMDAAIATSVNAQKRVFKGLSDVMGSGPTKVKPSARYSNKGYEWAEYGDAFAKEYPDVKDEKIWSKRGEAEREWQKKIEETMRPLMDTYDPTKHSLDEMYAMKRSAIQVLVDKQLIGEEFGKKLMQRDSTDNIKTMLQDLLPYEAKDEEQVAALSWLRIQEDTLKEILKKPVTQAVRDITDLLYNHIKEHEADFNELVPKWSNRPNVKLEAPNKYSDANVATLLKGISTTTYAGFDYETALTTFGPRIGGISALQTHPSLFREYTKMGSQNILRPDLNTLGMSNDREMQGFAEYMVAQSGVTKLRSYLQRTQGTASVPPMSQKAWREIGDRSKSYNPATGGPWLGNSEMKRIGGNARYGGAYGGKKVQKKTFSGVTAGMYHQALMDMRKVFYTNAMKGITQSNDKFVLRSLTSAERTNVVGHIDRTWDKQEHGGMHYRIKGVFAIDGSPAEKKFQEAKKRLGGATKMLYHGTHFAAACSINRDQFRIGKTKVGRMLGSGVYFAENSSKSAQYLSDAGFSRHGTHGILFATEVATGRETPYGGQGDTIRVRKGESASGRVLRNTEYAVKDPTQAIPRYWIDVEVT
jgi:hypothetical protein